ncbi:HAMP domain-containing sensor histidine kinase [Actinomadura sp. DC4]|uniref:sensor histidine kinase n=1 Tax=Actinomadura sp. DC4 TaxID=3055069 RepID=UPI0025AF2EBA|nr:HAMP domain-containing sensor histidine kinase [Actinomadura sp. DC4]MDN3352642.1 HAMP domain-containing sensor histidine kinase [Actinomadura sp. DC4]
MRRLRPPATVRVRLTALYGGLFLAATTAVLVTVNLLLKRVLDRKVMMYAISVKNTPAQPCDPPPDPALLVQRRLNELPEGSPARTAATLRSSVLDYQWGVTLIAVAVLACVAVFAGWWLAGRVLRPLHRITATARRLSLANLDERIALAGPRDELKELADTFDAMLERLERAVESQRRFVANASHELRTPLAIQRAAIQIGLADTSPEQVERMRAELLEANRRTERLIDGLLTLARGERGLDAREPVRLDEIAEEAVAASRPEAERAGVMIRPVIEPLTVAGDAVLLTQLTTNLLHNAIRYNHEGGVVDVGVSPERGLTVRNSGPAVPAASVPELFEPFRRLRTRTGRSDGAGLGLSIVAAIAHAHDASVVAVPNPGGGLDVAVRLPALLPALVE